MKKTYKEPRVVAVMVRTKPCMLNVSMGVSDDKVDNATAEGKYLDSVSFTDSDDL